MQNIFILYVFKGVLSYHCELIYYCTNWCLCIMRGKGLQEYFRVVHFGNIYQLAKIT